MGKIFVMNYKNSLVYIGLGSNMGDSNHTIKEAIEQIIAFDNIKLIKKSNIMETKPVDYLQQNNFLNQIILIETTLSPNKLLNKLQSIEKKLGKNIKIPKGPRTIDLDILLIDDKIINEDNLTIPHPEIKNRNFILEHLIELNNKLRDPHTQKTYKEILTNGNY